MSKSKTSSTALERQMREVRDLYDQGKRDLAYARNREILNSFPNSAEVNYFFAKLQFEMGLYKETLTSLKKGFSCLGIAPEFKAYYELLTRLQTDRAIDLWEEGALWLIQHYPKNGVGWDYYGLALLEREKFVDAEIAFRQALALLPNNPHVLNNLACSLNSQDRGAEAERFLSRVVQIDPKMAVAYNNLGNAQRMVGRAKEAITNFLKSLELVPNQAFTYNNLGLAYRVDANYQEAITCYKKALELQPGLFQVYPNLIDAMRQNGQLQEAIDLAEEALSKTPDLPELWACFADVLRDANHLDAAVEAYIRALSYRADAHSNFNLRVYTNLLFCLNYHPDLSAEVIFDAYKEFDKRFAQPYFKKRTYANDKNPTRKLKIAYATQSFYNHVCAYFLIPLLEHQDRTQFEIIAYSNVVKEDEKTQRYKEIVDQYIVTTGMTDDEFASRVIADKIDIFIDLSGHTNGNRLAVFARKPAPVSVHWLDYGYTTGLSAIDYYLTDKPTVEGGAQRYFSEKIWALDGPAYAYRPNKLNFEQTPLPYFRNGYITFGTLSRSVRLNHRVVRVWATILDAIPNSHLVIDSGDFKDPAVQDEMASRFVKYGIERERIKVGYSTPVSAAMREFDIGLDCFPHNSGTTLIECIYMGIPYITLAGRPSIGRIGSSILHAVGHPEWIANSEAEYAEKAVILAHDIERLAYLREHMRGETENSPLMDELGFARSVDKAFRQMWQIYCESEAS
ncbi:tetratricopeptide repeat protein [Undibacterium sp. Di24W]|uniref:tetratricopeptide repeat protein n=1 Tax=Undibacterium sp. Di24W TaxID=3413033 RepID=UPI003BF02DA7